MTDAIRAGSQGNTAGNEHPLVQKGGKSHEATIRQGATANMDMDMDTDPHRAAARGRACSGNAAKREQGCGCGVCSWRVQLARLRLAARQEEDRYLWRTLNCEGSRLRPLYPSE